MSGKLRRKPDVRGLLIEYSDSVYQIGASSVLAILLIGLLSAIFIDDDLLDAVSAGLLLITSMVCRCILDVRRAPETPMFSGPTRIWAFISLGFMFLALDEIFSIHEKMDPAIHWILGIEQTSLSSRIDTFIIFLYCVIGVFLIYSHRKEFLKLTEFSKYFIIGFIFIFLALLFDAVEEGNELFDTLSLESDAREKFQKYVKHTEDILEILAEAMFLFGFLAILRKFSFLEEAAAHEGTI